MAKQVVILAAGLGTRLGRPHPKPLTQLRSGESIMRRAVDALRTAYGDDVFVTAVVGFKLDLVIEAMPDISFVYNEVYDSTNTSKSLLKALQLSQPGGVLWLNGDVVFDPQVLPLIQEHIETGPQLRVREHRVGGRGGGEVHPRRRRLHQGALQAGRRRARRGRRASTSSPPRTRPRCSQRLAEVDDQDYFERGIEVAIEQGRPAGRGARHLRSSTSSRSTSTRT